MHHHALTSPAAAIGLLALAALVVACLTLGWRRGRPGAALLVAAFAGGMFQLGHFAEHVAQAGYWASHRGDAPWMTPWATALARSFQRFAEGTPGFGMEAMHLAGNAMFLAGAVAIAVVLSRLGPPESRRLASTAVVIQGLHVVEHVALTITLMSSGRPIGVSTLFGAVGPGPGLWTYRIWWHLTVNAVATAVLTVAVLRRRPAATVTPTHLQLNFRRSP